MSIKSTFIYILLFAFVFLDQYTTFGQVDIIINGQFESNTTGWSVTSPAGQNTTNPNCGVGNGWVGNDGELWQSGTAIPGATYTLNFDGLKDNSSVGWSVVNFAFYTNTWTTLSTQNSNITTSNYTTNTITVVAPANAAIWGIWVGSGNGATMKIDCMELIETTSSTSSCANNLLLNSGFENGSTDWFFQSNTSTTSTTSNSGTSSAYANGGTGGPTQNFSASEGEVFSLSAYGKNTGSEISMIGLTFFDATWNTLQSSYKYFDNGNIWTEYFVSACAPPNTAHVQALGWKSNGSGAAWWDDFCLQEWVLTPQPSCAGNDCELMPAFNQVIWDISFTGTNDGWLDYDNADMRMCDLGNGRIKMTGNLINGRTADFGGMLEDGCGAQDGWYVDIELFDRQTWPEHQENYEIDPTSSCATNYVNFDYWDVVGTYTGLGCNTGRTITVNGPSSGYRLQVGYGGNKNTCDFSMATWFDTEENGNSVLSDVYAKIDYTCYQNMLVADETILLEAECGVKGNKWLTTTDNGASNSTYISVINGNNSTTTPPTGANNIITLAFDIVNANDYNILGRVKAPSSNENAFWARVDNGNWVRWASIPINNNWVWNQIHDSDLGDTAVIYNLQAGPHTLDIAYNEDGTLLDKIMISSKNIAPNGQGASASNCVPEICGDYIDNDNDGDIDCLDSECTNIYINNTVVSGTIDHPLRDVATVTFDISWDNAPSNDNISISIGNNQKVIDIVNGATSPQTITMMIEADGSTNKLLEAKWVTNTSYCPSKIYITAPNSISSDSIDCNILYIYGLDKPENGYPWDRGWEQYLDEINGSNSVTSVLSQNDASGMGTYDPANPTTPITITLSDYDLIVVSATTEYHISSAFVAELKDTESNLINGNVQLIDDFKFATGIGLRWDTDAYINNTDTEEIYDYDNPTSYYNKVLTYATNYSSAADARLWGQAGNYGNGVNGILVHYEDTDIMAGVSASHGHRVYIGYHMNGFYNNPTNNGNGPAPSSEWFVPENDLTVYGKEQFELAILDASIACGVDPCYTIVETSNDSYLCNGDSKTITATASLGTAPYTYNWDNSLGSGDSKQVSPSATTTYTVTVTDNVGCTATDQITLTVNSNPNVNVISDQTICSGDSITLTASGASNYLWDTGENTAAITVSPTVNTTYEVQGYNSNSTSGNIVTEIGFIHNNFSTINSNILPYGQADKLFDNIDNLGGYTFHAQRINSSQTWGVAYDLESSALITDIGIDRRNDCCTDRGEGGVMQIYNEGTLVYTSNTVTGSGDGILNASPSPNVIGDEVRYVFIGGANTANNDALLNFSEWIITGETVCTDVDEAVVTVISVPTITNVVTVDASCGASNGSIQIFFDDIASESTIQFSLDGGATFPSQYTVNDNSGSLVINNLPAALYHIVARYPSNTCLEDLGNFTINNADGFMAAIACPSVIGTRQISNHIDQCWNVGNELVMGFPGAFDNYTGAHQYWKIISGGEIVEYANGTAEFSLNVQNISRADLQMNVKVIMSDRTYDISPMGPATNACSGTDFSDMYYYENFYGIMTGIGNLAGTVLSLKGNNKAMQIGTGGTPSAPSSYGLGAWIKIHVLSQPNSGPTVNEGWNVDFHMLVSGSTYTDDDYICRGGCEGEDVTLTALAIAADPSTLNYQWSNNATTKSITVSAQDAANYSVTVTQTGSSCIGIDDITLDADTPPTVDAGSDQNICLGDSITLTASGATNYEWNTGETTASITVSPTTTTTYEVLGYNNTSLSGNLVDEIGFFQDNFTTINSWNPSVYGQPSSLFDDEDQTSAACFAVFRQNSNQTWGIGYELGASALITDIGIDRRNDCCTDRGEGGVMQIYNEGTLVYTSNTVTGSGDGILNASPSPNVIGDEVRYVFIGGANTANNDAALNFSEWIITGETVCTDVDEVLVTVNLAPTLTTSADTDICLGESTLITATASGGSTPYTYYIDGVVMPNGQATVSPTSETSYVIRVEDANGCESDQDTITIDVKPNPVSGILSSPTSCINESTTISASPLVANATYNWTFENGTPATSSNSSVDVLWSSVGDKAITLTVTLDGCTVEYIDTIEVTQIIAAVSDDGLLTCSQTEVILTATPAGMTYNWSNNTSNQTATVSSPGTYTVTVTDSNGCTSTASSTVLEDITTPTADAGTDQKICASEDILLTATGAGTYLWSHNAATTDTVTVSPTSTTTYTVTVTASNGCTDTDQVTVNVNEGPTNSGSITGDEINCGSYDPTPIVENVPASGSVGDTISYTWQYRTFDCNTNQWGSWSDIPGINTKDYDCPTITTSTQYRRLAGQIGCSSWLISNVITKEVIENQTNPGVIAADQSGCDSLDPAEITGSPATGGCQGTLEYQWQYRISGGNWTDIAGATGVNYNPSEITETTEYQRLVKSDPCPFIASNIVTMTIDKASFTAVALGSNLDCESNCTGTIDVVVDHATTGDYMLEYTYNGTTTQVGPFTQDSSTISNLCAGSYSNIKVIATLTNCTDTWSGNISISESHADWEHVTHASNLSDCHANTCDGSFVIDANLGVTGPFNVTYKYNGTLVNLGPFNHAGDITIDSLCAGVYSEITIISIDSGCSDVWPDDIIISTPDLDANITTIIDDSCQLNEGTITLNVSNGVYPYTIEWKNESGTHTGTETLNHHGSITIDSLIGGNKYCFKVTDSNGCVVN